MNYTVVVLPPSERWEHKRSTRRHKKRATSQVWTVQWSKIGSVAPKIDLRGESKPGQFRIVAMIIVKVKRAVSFKYLVTWWPVRVFQIAITWLTALSAGKLPVVGIALVAVSSWHVGQAVTLASDDVTLALVSDTNWSLSAKKIASTSYKCPNKFKKKDIT